MDIFERILKASELYDDNRPGLNDGGMLVKPSADGSRPGYAKDFAKEDAFTPSQKEKIKKAFPEIKFDFDAYKYGVKKYPTGDDTKTSKDFTKVYRFIKKGFTKEMGQGLNVRGQPYSVEGKRLSLKDQEKIKSLFELPPGEEWDFKTHKYGIKQAGRENLLVRMARVVKDKKPWKVAADFGTPEGWMILQMNRVFENEKKSKVKRNNLTYQPVYKTINGRQRIIGFKDNTPAGGGNFYYGLKNHAKKNATDFVNHGDFKLNQKLVDISKRSFNAPNEVITGLLKEKGFEGQVNLNQLINYLSGTEANSAENIKNAIVRHHNSGVAFGSATNDLSLTTQTINAKIREAEKRIRTGNILNEDIQLLKNNNIFVRGKDGRLYGAGSKSPAGQFKQIEKDVETALRKGIDFKGNKFTNKQLVKSLMKFCPKSNGGEAGVCSIDEAMDGLIKESKQLQSGNMNEAQAKKTAEKIRGVTRVGTGSTLKGLLGPYGLAGEVVIDSAFMANNMLEGGDTYKEALSKSLLKYAMPTGARKQLEKETDINRNILGSDTQGLAADYVSAQEKYDDLINKYENLERIKKDETFDPDTLIPTYSPKDEIKAQKEFQRSMNRAEPTYGKNIFDILKFGSPEQQAFAAKEEVFDAEKMQRRMDYDKKILGPVKSLFDTGFYSPAQLNLLQKQADRESLEIGQIPDQLKTQQIADFGGVANLAGGGIAGLSGGVDKGPAPESGPASGGLLKLFKRVRNY